MLSAAVLCLSAPTPTSLHVHGQHGVPPGHAQAHNETWPAHIQVLLDSVQIGNGNGCTETMFYSSPDLEHCNNRHRSLQSNNDVIDGVELEDWLDAQQWAQFQSDDWGSGDSSSIHIQHVTISATEASTKGALAFAPGSSESCYKMAENLYTLHQFGYGPIFCIDHRGQGRSGRMIDNSFYQDGTLRNHVEFFEDYVLDIRDWLNNVVVPATPTGQPLYGACHSMGCGILFWYLMEEAEAARAPPFTAIAANAPLIAANTHPYDFNLARAIGWAMWFVGLSNRYPPTKGEKSWDEFYGENAVFLPGTTSSQARWARRNAMCRKYKTTRYHTGVEGGHEGVCLKDITVSKVNEFYDLTDKVSGYSGPELGVPILLQQAGNEDDPTVGTVQNPFQDAFCNAEWNDCKLTKYDGSAHNIWWERDAIRTPALSEVDEFFVTIRARRV